MPRIRYERFGGEWTLVPDSTPRVPVTTGDLLRDLGASEETKREQRARVSEWLRYHEPSPVLAASLRRAGLI